MKANTHPTWFPEAKVVCACGSTFITGSTQESIRVEICSKCHPLFTGQQKFVDTAGQVEKFDRKKQKSAEKSEIKKQIKESRSQKTDKKPERLSLRDLLMQARKDAAS